MERLKWRNTVVSDRRKELAYGPDSKALRMPSSGKNIWRDSYQRDPPPLNQGSGRGSKRKAPPKKASDKPRNVRRRTTRKTKNSLAWIENNWWYVEWASLVLWKYLYNIGLMHSTISYCLIVCNIPFFCIFILHRVLWGCAHVWLDREALFATEVLLS